MSSLTVMVSVGLVSWALLAAPFVHVHPAEGHDADHADRAVLHAHLSAHHADDADEAPEHPSGETLTDDALFVGFFMTAAGKSSPAVLSLGMSAEPERPALRRRWLSAETILQVHDPPLRAAQPRAPPA